MAAGWRKSTVSEAQMGDYGSLVYCQQLRCRIVAQMRNASSIMAAERNHCEQLGNLPYDITLPASTRRGSSTSTGRFSPVSSRAFSCEDKVRQALTRIGVRQYRANLLPYFRERYDRASHLTDKGVALLVTGHARTMVQEEAVSEWAHSFAAVRQHEYTSLSAFAYLELELNLEGLKGQSSVPEFNTLERGGPSAARREMSREALRARVLTAISRWGVDHSALEIHLSNGSRHPLLPDTQNACPGMRGVPGLSDIAGINALQQFLKVEAATNMMRAAERVRGFRFATVVRLRPDLCLRPATPFLRFALQQLRLRSTGPPLPVGFSLIDGAAVYGRWAADAYASFWRFENPFCSVCRSLSLYPHLRTSVPCAALAILTAVSVTCTFPTAHNSVAAHPLLPVVPHEAYSRAATICITRCPCGGFARLRGDWRPLRTRLVPLSIASWLAKACWAVATCHWPSKA
jgi:hypothetical protein